MHTEPSIETTPNRPLQGTVAQFDAQLRRGSVVCDDGQPLEFTGESLDTAVRLLRPGQRVHWRDNAHGEIAHLTMITLPIATHH